MPLKTHRPAPPPPVGSSKQNMSRSSTFKSHVPNDTNNNAKVISRPTVIRPLGFKPAKRKPPPRPAPPKSYQTKSSHKSPTPDLLADLRDIFTTPINPALQSKPTVIKPATGLRSSFKKTPAPPRPPSASAFSQPRNQQNSLIDFDSPAHYNSKHSHCPAEKSNSALVDLFDLDPFFSNQKSYQSNIGKSNSASGSLATIAMNNPNATKKVASTLWTTMVNNPKATKAVASTAWNLHNSSNTTNPGSSTSVFMSTQSNKNMENFVTNNWNNEKSQTVISKVTTETVKKNTYNYSLGDSYTPALNWNDKPTTSTKESYPPLPNWNDPPVTPVSKSADVPGFSVGANKIFSPPEPQFPPPPPPPATEDDNLSPMISPCSISCRALYDFVANDADELTFKANDLIGLLDKPSDDWWLGTLNGDKGLFPSSYVDVVVEGNSFTNLDKKEFKSEGCFVKALYTFPAEQVGDLAFQEGDEIEVLYRINQNWLFGKCNGQEGQFPANFVQKIVADQDNENNCSTCLAKYQFQAENGDELAFDEGEVIVIVEKLSNDWWKGYLQRDKNKKLGIFPSTFVEV